MRGYGSFWSFQTIVPLRGLENISSFRTIARLRSQCSLRHFGLSRCCAVTTDFRHFGRIAVAQEVKLIFGHFEPNTLLHVENKYLSIC